MLESNLAKDEEAALKAAGLLEKFQKLPPSHQREYLKWIDEAEKPETRIARIAKMADMLSSDQKQPR